MTPEPPVEADILVRFQSLMQRVADIHASEFVGVDVTMPQAKVLYIVSVRPGTAMSALATELGVGLSAVSGLVDRLVVAGYLERREDPSDRRQHLISATPAGAAALDRIRELRIELMRRLIAGLSAAELSAMQTALAALDREARRLARPTSTADRRHERTVA